MEEGFPGSRQIASVSLPFAIRSLRGFRYQCGCRRGRLAPAFSNIVRLGLWSNGAVWQKPKPKISFIPFCGFSKVAKSLRITCSLLPLAAVFDLIKVAFRFNGDYLKWVPLRSNHNRNVQRDVTCVPLSLSSITVYPSSSGSEKI